MRLPKINSLVQFPGKIRMGLQEKETAPATPVRMCEPTWGPCTCSQCQTDSQPVTKSEIIHEPVKMAA